MQKSTFVTASVIAIGATLFMSSAGAQSVAGVTGSQGSGDNSGAPTGLEEVVVTAQRREERNQTVPIAITAFTSAQLQQQNITTAQDLNGLVPSLVVSPNGQASRETEGYTLRGMGPSYEGASAVVVYLNEVPLPQAFTTNQQGGPGNFVDLDTLQVLAGPQGTLFGRNTTGGAVLLVPHKPTNDFGGYLQVSGGNYAYNAVEGVVNVPVIDDKLLVRVSGTYQDRGGYTHDYVWNKDRDDRHYFAGRIGVTFRPADGVENYLLAYSQYSNNNGTGYVNNGIILPTLLASGDCTGACSVYKYNANLAKQLGPRGVLDDVDEFDTTRTWELIDKTSIDLNEQLTINNIVSYQTYWKNYSLDEAGLPLELADEGSNRPTFAVPSLARFGIAKNGFSDSAAFGPRDDLEQVTEELQLQGNMLDNHLNFTAGGFYFDEQPRGDQLNRFTFGCANIGNCTPLIQTYGVSNESEAVYAQSTLNLGIVTPALEDLRVTAGYRYTWDTVDGATNFYAPLAGGYNYCVSSGAVTTKSAQCAYAATLHSSAPTFTFGVDYKPIDNVLVFAKFSRGYKSGGFNAYAVRESTRTFDPEFVNSVETGFKSDWRLGTVPARLNVTWYRSSYSDIQKPDSDFNHGLTGSRIVQGAALIEGLEAEATIRPISAVELGGNMSYTDARFTTCGTNCLPFGVPRWIYSLHGTFDLPVPEEWGKMSLYGAFSFVGQQVISLTEPGSILNSYGLLNLSAKWDSIFQSDFDLELFATNATDKLYRITNSNISSSGFYASVYGEPQMYGARLRYRFGSEAAEPAATPAAYVPPPPQPVAPAPVAKSYLVFFDFNKSDLSSQAVQIVNQAAANAGAAHVTQLTVTGHTDTVGSDAYNMRLSRRRAESVAAQLEKDGISSSEIEIVAKGKRDLLVPTADGVKEPQNRRVQIVYDNGATS